MFFVGVYLLIEPVWNRNTGNRHVLRSYGFLLIEPVWNRNVVEKDMYTFEVIVF